MDCKKIRESFTDYLDTTLADDFQSRVDEHLDACPRCREELRLFSSTIEMLHELPPLAPPSDLLPAIHAKLDRPSSLAEYLTRWWKRAGSMSWQNAIATVAIAFSAMVVLKTFSLVPQADNLQPAPNSATSRGNTISLPQAGLERPYNPNTIAPMRVFATPKGALGLPALERERASASLYDNFIPPQQAQLARLHRPDFSFSIASMPLDQKAALYNQLTSRCNWYAKHYGDELLVFLSARELPAFQEILLSHHAVSQAFHLDNLAARRDKKIVTISVQLR